MMEINLPEEAVASDSQNSNQNSVQGTAEAENAVAAAEAAAAQSAIDVVAEVANSIVSSSSSSDANMNVNDMGGDLDPDSDLMYAESGVDDLDNCPIKCEHRKDKSFCRWNNLSEAQKRQVIAKWETFTSDKQRLKYRVSLCMRVHEAQTHKPLKKHRSHATTYFFKPPPLLEADSYRVCQGVFARLTNTATRTLNRWSQLLVEVGDFTEKSSNLGGLRRPCTRTGPEENPTIVMEPISTETLADIEHFIKNFIPTHAGRFQGQEVTYVGVAGDQTPVSHERFLAQFNAQRESEHKEPIKLWAWKQVWYKRMNLRDKLRFHRRCSPETCAL
eukprot:TRINITY_DN169_c0_g1_i1.p1 TRINITY_DN169_c0_g1~~TRINITY_DN169_c0_g1_i1.p1  ORF type:complete len:331 (+),score=76.78 TRINITY_DN169_c0_g1_i1:121-1113(+)